jgi:hypothetical protein
MGVTIPPEQHIFGMSLQFFVNILTISDSFPFRKPSHHPFCSYILFPKRPKYVETLTRFCSRPTSSFRYPQRNSYIFTILSRQFTGVSAHSFYHPGLCIRARPKALVCIVYIPSSRIFTPHVVFTMNGWPPVLGSLLPTSVFQTCRYDLKTS